MAKDRPDDLSRAYAIAMVVGPRWREHMENSLNRMQDTKDILNSIW